MEDLINRAIDFAMENGFELFMPKDEQDYDKINTMRIKGKEKEVHLEIE